MHEPSYISNCLKSFANWTFCTDYTMPSSSFKSNAAKLSKIILLCLLIAAIWGPAAVQVIIFCKQKYDTALLEGNRNKTTTDDIPYNCSDSFPSSDSNISSVCSDRFFCKLDKGYCVPDCYKWYDSMSDWYSSAAFSIGILTSLLALTISCFRYKKMMKFPSILIFYMMINILILCMTYLILYNIGGEYKCASRDLEEATSNSFCTVSGILYLYNGLQLGMWWLIYEAMIFFMIYFPFKTRVIIQSEKVKYVHIISIVIGLTVPLYSPVMMGSLNVNICIAFTFMYNIFEILYYAYNLPILLLFCVGSTLLVLIYWKLYNQRQKHLNLGTPKAKVLLVTTFFLVYNSVIMIWLIISTLKYLKLQQELEDYFLCERLGVHNCNKDFINTHFFIFIVPAIIVILLLGMLPIVLLMFVTNFQYLKYLINQLYVYVKSATTC